MDEITCPTCQQEHHDSCALVHGCSCCADTAAQDGLYSWYTCTTDDDGTEYRYIWWAEDENHAIEQSYLAWPDEFVHFAFQA